MGGVDHEGFTFGEIIFGSMTVSVVAGDGGVRIGLDGDPVD